MSLEYTKTHTVSGYSSGDVDITFTFDYLDDADIKVYKTDTSGTALILGTDWQFKNKKEVTLLGASSNYTIANNDVFLVQRETATDDSFVTYAPGSSIRAEDLNNNQLQALYSAQEREERSLVTTGGTLTGNLVLDDSNIVIEEDDDSVTITAPTLTANRTLTIPDTTGTIVTTGDENTVTTTMVDDSLVNANIATNAEIAVSKLADGDARQLLQTSANGNDVEWTSNVDVPGTLDVVGNTTLDGTLQVVGTTTFTNETDNTLGSENTGSVQFDGGVGIAKNLTVKVNLDVDGTANLDAVDIDGEVNLAVNTVTAAGTDLRIQDGNAAAFQVSEGTNAYMTFDTTTDARRVETNQILDIQQGWEIGGTTVDVTANELNLLDDRTISGATISTDNTVRQNELPTTQAIVAYVENQLDQIDGFVAIATEDNFPATQPPENVVVSIGNVGGLEVDQNGQATNARTQGNGSDNVTITGIEENFRPTSGTRAVDAGVRMLVISTGANNTYTYHKATLKESDLINLSNDINDFGNRYRVSGEEPDDSLDDGDLWWDTANDQLNAYDGDAWAPVTASGEFIRLVLRDTDGTEPTFDGNVRDYNLVREDDTSVAGSITTAQQLLLSVDGVMQRPNAGTSIDTDGIGFCRVDSDTIQLAGAPATDAEVFAIQMGTATEINTPAEDSVDSQHYVDDSIDSQHLNSTTGSEAVTTDVIRENAVGADALASSANTDGDRAITTNHIRDNVVNEAKLQVSNDPQDGFFLSAQSGNTGGLTWAQISSTAITNGTSNVSVANNGDITATRAGTARLTVNNTGIEVDGVADFDSTDAILLPTGTTEQRSSEVAGAFRYSTTLGALEFYNGTNWILSSAATPTITSITGSIILNTATTLTINGSDFGTANLDVRFVQSADSIDETVTVTPTSQTQASVAVPANVRNNVTAGNDVTITVENEAGLTSDGFDQEAVEFPSGGDSVTTSGDFRIHTFEQGGTFVNTIANLEVEYLIIAGGGGGGGQRGGGGGAGGYRTNVSGQTSGRGASAEASMTLTNTGNFTVTVGAGGTAGGNGVGGQGGNSTFNSITASGGGFGRTDDENGADGGCGAGGGGGGSFSGGVGTAGQGHDGADSTTNSFSNAGSSGGGAGSAGTTTNGGSIGSGGAGVSSNITGTAVTRASGGGGGSSNSSGNGTAQTGGGAAGGNSSTQASNATANTGGGGGGGGTGGGSAGGSGIVIIRYDTTTI